VRRGGHDRLASLARLSVRAWTPTSISSSFTEWVVVVMEAFSIGVATAEGDKRVAFRLARKPANGRYDALSVTGSSRLRQNDNEGVAC
jgi:hypothetical protein